MRAFEWASPTTVEEAVKLLTTSPPATATTFATPPVDSDEIPRPMGGGQESQGRDWPIACRELLHSGSRRDNLYSSLVPN